MIEIDYQRSKRFYPKQLQILNCKTRFMIVEGSSQCGKTETLITWLYEKFLNYKYGDIGWWIEPTYEMTKSLGYFRMKKFLQECKDIFDFNESALSIHNKFTGGILKFKSGDRPDNLFGDTVQDIVLDEASRMKEEVYFATYSRLTATQGRMMLIGNVVGINNWNYRLARKAESGELSDWSYLKITAKDAIEAGVLTQDVIDSAERTYPKGVFLELFYGIPFENASNKFFYSFDERRHVGQCRVNYMYPVYLSFDFNYNPICCGLFQYYDGIIYCPEIIKLENSNIYNLCTVIRQRHGNATFLVTGDATGTAHSAITKDNLNYYRIIKNELNLSSGAMRIPSVNPKFEENQVLCNAILEHRGVQIDPDKAAPLIFDLKFVQIDNNGKIMKSDRSDPTQQADSCFVGETLITTNSGYKQIKDICVGDYVLTSNGYNRVINTRITKRPVYEFTLTDNTKIICTNDHKFFTKKHGYIDIFTIFEKKLKVCKYKSAKEEKSIFTTTEGITLETESSHISMFQTLDRIIQNVCTGKYGMTIMEKYHKALVFITGITIRLITELKTLNWLKNQNTQDIILQREIKNVQNCWLNLLKQVKTLHRHGIKAKRVENGIPTNVNNIASDTLIMELIFVNIAAKNTTEKRNVQDFVPMPVNRGGADTIKKIWQHSFVLNAEKSLKQENIYQKHFVQENVLCNYPLSEIGVKSMRYAGIETVYDIEVEGEHNYFANDFLVHNCDLFRYYLNVFHKDILKVSQLQKYNSVLGNEMELRYAS